MHKYASNLLTGKHRFLCSVDCLLSVSVWHMAPTQMSYLCQPSVQRLQHQTISELLDTQVAETQSNEVVVLYDGSLVRFCLTFAQYQVQSQALAAALLEIGLARGDRVVLRSPNSLEYCVSLMALWRIGANVVSRYYMQGLSCEDILEAIGVLHCVALICHVHENDQEHREPTIQAIRKIFRDAAYEESYFKFSVTE